ncbi:MAG: sigma-70 family RNA polymerase sigma factor [Chloroflexi bacterium]|nr:sigma-70 family RNA polymerase sigma factor [Chloroflexota bacterium]
MDNVDLWVQQAQRGDMTAVQALYEHFVGDIFRYTYYRVSSRRDAEDLTAEVFVKMVEGLPRYRYTGAPFQAWLYRIANARVVDFHRRQRRRPEGELSENLTDTSTRPEESVQHRQELEALRNALHQLSVDEQTILILRFVENKSHQEAAEIMQKTYAGIKALQHRALKHLAAVLGSEAKVRHYIRGGRS